MFAYISALGVLMKLLVVESPNKVKKLQAYLREIEPGAWRVVATVGHWRGLPAMDGNEFADVVDLASDGWLRERFEVTKPEVERRLRSEIGTLTDKQVYLASDPDREGEAIAWHVAEHFHLTNPFRVEFHEITKAAVAKAIRTPRKINVGLVDAQRARSLLDYLLGMELSRRLWRFGCKSAGRVQSCALRIVVSREQAIRDFTPSNFWTVEATYRNGVTAFVGGAPATDEDELDNTEEHERSATLAPRRFGSQVEAEALVRAAEGVTHVVESVDVKPAIRRPPPPFTTASLLAAGSSAGLSPDQVSAAAQALFEKGLVTYIRTDSVALSDEGVANIRQYLASHHPALLPAKPQVFADKAGAQGAHEAIRPTSMVNDEAESLRGNEQTVYRLIWDRALRCQMAAAEFEQMVVTIAPWGCQWRLVALGSRLVRPGWRSLDNSPPDEMLLPELKAGQRLDLDRMGVKTGKTKAPRRFSVKSLIKYLERNGVGRPSTYAAIINTLVERGYVELKKSELHPCELGFTAEGLLRAGFETLTEEGFTAVTEQALDEIERGKCERVAFFRAFKETFDDLLAGAGAAFTKYASSHSIVDRTAVVEHSAPCPKCAGPMVVRVGKLGKFAACKNRDCGGTREVDPPVVAKAPCPLCGARVIEQKYLKNGTPRRFWKCDGCNWRSQTKPSGAEAPKCPGCGATMQKVKGGKGPFWGCPRYPTCKSTMSISGVSAAKTKPKRTQAVPN